VAVAFPINHNISLADTNEWLFVWHPAESFKTSQRGWIGLDGYLKVSISDASSPFNPVGCNRSRSK